MCPYIAGGRSRRGSPNAGTTVLVVREQGRDALCLRDFRGGLCAESTAHGSVYFEWNHRKCRISTGKRFSCAPRILLIACG